MLKKYSWLFVFFTFIFTLVLFHSSLNYYFFQDDWFLLNWVKTHSFPSFFQFRTDIIYWRPFSMPILFFSLNKLFALNSFAFHIFSFSIFFALILCVYKLFQLITKSAKASIIGAFLYGTWSIHYISLSWLSTTSYIIGPLLQILCFAAFVLFAKSKKNKYYLVSFLLFLLALASSEFTIVLPLIIIAYNIIKNKKLMPVELSPFFITVAVYILLRFVLFPVPAKGDYQIRINFQVINNYIWYILWSANIPESFKSLIFINHPKNSLKILLQFWQISLASSLFIVVFAMRLKKSLKFTKPYIYLGIIWFTVGLLPVIFLTDHSYPVYLSFAGLGIILLVSKILEKTSAAITITCLFIWFIASYFSTNFTKNTHWIRNEQAVSKAYTQYVLKKIPNPNHNAAFIFRPANENFFTKNKFYLADEVETLKLSLNYDHAIKVIYNDQSLRSVFLTYKQNIDLPPNIAIYDIDPLE